MSTRTFILALTILFSFNSVSAFWGSRPRLYKKFRRAHERALRQGIRDGSFTYKRCNINLRDGRLDGLCECHNRRGTKVISSNYINGRLDGETIVYYNRSMLPKFISNYRDNRLEGIQKRFYRSGTERNVYHAYNNLRDGVFQSFYRSGELSSECDYARGVLHGFCENYRKDGAISSVIEFVNGVRQYTEQELALMAIEAQEDQADALRQQAWEMNRQTNLMRRNLHNNRSNFNNNHRKSRKPKAKRYQEKKTKQKKRRKLGDGFLSGKHGLTPRF